MSEGHPMSEQEAYERDLLKRQLDHLERVRNRSRLWQPCMHDSCPTCHGTGVGMHGPCIHAISCPCPKCSP